MGYVNVRAQRTPRPEASSEWAAFGPPVVNGPRLIVAGTKHNALFISQATAPSCCFLMIGNAFPNECSVSAQTQKLI